MHNVEIKVYPIAKTQVDRLAVRKWLDDLGADQYEIPDKEASSDPALLIAMAAKRCYLSFQPGLNPNVSKVRLDLTEYLDNVLKSGHGSVLEHASWSFAIEGVSRVFCYHPSTEILTKSGWKLVENLSLSDSLLTKNPVTGEARWSKEHKLHSFKYEGPLHYWKCREEHGPMVTPDHRLWAAPYDLNKCKKLKAFEILDAGARKIKASDIWGKRFVVDHRVNFKNTYDLEKITIGKYTYNTELFFEWLGYVATDGTIVKDNSGSFRVVINQIKIPQCNRIREICLKLFGDRYKYFAVHDRELRSWVIKNIGRVNKERRLVSLFKLSPRLISSFLLGAEAGDGVHGASNHISVICSTESLAKDYQVLYAILGYGSRVEVIDNIGKTNVTPRGAIITCKQLCYLTHKHRRGLGASIVRKHHQFTMPYKGQVYCPETKDGVVYVRHPNGCATWCGNTGEMNRHRAGVGISEGSMRFIRFEDIAWWLPTSLRLANGDTMDTVIKKQKSVEVFNRAFTQDEQNYKELCDIWGIESMKEFSRKKQLTSCFRRIVGMGCATGGVWTMNMRAVRHILAMRTTEHAEEEIYHVFSRIAKIMVESEPMVCGDFVQDAQGFWSPKYPKV